MKSVRRSAVFLFLLLGVAGCEESSPGGMPLVKLKIGSRTFTLEVARSMHDQETGLMHRDTMPQDHGMIFVFPKEERRQFWMKDTRFGLDIVFVDAAGKISSIKQMKSYDQSITDSDVPVQYAIELNAGAAAEAGANVGDVLTIPAGAKAQ